MYTIEERLRLLSDASDLMLVGSIRVYGAKMPRVKITTHKREKKPAERRAA